MLNFILILSITILLFFYYLLFLKKRYFEQSLYDALEANTRLQQEYESLCTSHSLCVEVKNKLANEKKALLDENTALLEKIKNEQQTNKEASLNKEKNSGNPKNKRGRKPGYKTPR